MLLDASEPVLLLPFSGTLTAHHFMRCVPKKALATIQALLSHIDSLLQSIPCFALAPTKMWKMKKEKTLENRFIATPVRCYHHFAAFYVARIVGDSHPLCHYSQVCWQIRWRDLPSSVQQNSSCYRWLIITPLLERIVTIILHRKC